MLDGNETDIRERCVLIRQEEEDRCERTRASSDSKSNHQQLYAKADDKAIEPFGEITVEEIKADMTAWKDYLKASGARTDPGLNPKEWRARTIEADKPNDYDDLFRMPYSKYAEWTKVIGHQLQGGWKRKRAACPRQRSSAKIAWTAGTAAAGIAAG